MTTAASVHSEKRSPYPPLRDYGVIGNCRTVALVSSGGSIDWLCLPHFSGPTVFAALLDRQRGGRFALAPRDIKSTSRRYISGTNVLETKFECRNGRLRLTDFMTVLPHAESAGAPQPQHELVRIAECLEGSVELDAVYDPRPGDARESPRIIKCGRLGWTWSHKGVATYLSTDLDFVRDGGTALSAHASLNAGETRTAVFAACENEAVVIRPLADMRQRLELTIDWWQAWAARCRYVGPYRAAVVRSCLALKLLTYALSGAVVAAPTTSLPEGPTGEGNWDYRYCWLRDASMVLRSFSELGYDWEATAFLEWLLHATKLTQPELQVLYDIHGETDLAERELPHLEGYRGIGPVRIGNAAHQQLQLDIYGEVVLAAYWYVRFGGALDHYERRLLEGFGHVVLKQWRRADQGIWETRTPPRHHTYSKLMCWVALDRILELHREVGLEIDETAYESACIEIRRDIDAHGYDEALASFVGYYGGQDPDAALLLLARYRYLEPDDPRMTGTCRHIVERLGVDGFIRRYPQGYSGVDVREHLFGVCSFWLVEYLAGADRLDEATDLFDRLVAAATELGLYAEEFDVETKEPVGNFPQAFTHVGLIRAALALEAARRDENAL